MPTEYDNIDRIGGTYETAEPEVKKINHYFHGRQVKTVFDLVKKMKLQNFDRIIDLGCSDDGWLDDYKKMEFQKIVGIDISSERADKAKKRGFFETFATNAYELPFTNDSESCIICNGMIVHVLQDSDRLKIFKEVKRVLKNKGIFIFNFTNAKAKGSDTDITLEYTRHNTIETIIDLVKKSGLEIEHIMPCFYIFPKIGAHKKISSISTKIVFPITNFILNKLKNLRLSEVIYLGVRKKIN